MLLLSLAFVGRAAAQTAPDSLPDPYTKTIERWAKLPEGRVWGSAAGISVDSKGDIWIFERCSANSCAGSDESPILEFDPSGRLLTSFGAGMFIFPHSLFVDKDDNIWVSDATGQDGKGQQVIEFSPQGKILLTLGKAGVAGDGPDTFNRPSGVVVAQDGDAGSPRERAQGVAQSGESRWIEVRKNADHQIGGVDSFDLFLHMLRDGFRFDHSAL